MLLSLAMELARGSCHCKTCRSVLVIARRAEITARQSHRKLPAFHCKQHLFLDYFVTLVMTKSKIANGTSAVRDD
jgi:RNase P subunit RPR2